jgi:Putative restriction endonuclease
LWLPATGDPIGSRSECFCAKLKVCRLQKKFATYEDILRLPEHHVGEIVNGVLHAQPRPAVPHSNAATILGEELGPPFRRKKGGPGGWIILDEPEIHLHSDIVVPDLAGWLKSRVPELPREASIQIAPDWVCEVLSPSTGFAPSTSTPPRPAFRVAAASLATATEPAWGSFRGASRFAIEKHYGYHASPSQC